MLVLFCLRLAAGLLAALLLLSPAQINPRFYRTHFLVAFGLAVVAAVFVPPGPGLGWWLALSAGLLLALCGYFSWSLEGAPLGRALIVTTAASLATALALTELAREPPATLPWRLCGDALSAALLGSATTAMLLGHSYLIAPGMSIAPLLRLVGALAGSTVARMLLAGAGLAAWSWTTGHSLLSLDSATVLWLPLRWGLGFAGPLVLGVMAWQTAKIRSTQSATGILYVVVLCCFLGELTGQLLQEETGFAL
jgi:hypothetical protein